MRRTVATLLVVASPLLMVAPVGASEPRTAGPAAQPAAPVTVAVVQSAPQPALQTPATPAAPAAPSVATPAVSAPVVGTVRPPAVHAPARAIPPKAPSTAGIDDTAYAARLQADLCQARQIFCGLDRGGRYPAH